MNDSSKYPRAISIDVQSKKRYHSIDSEGKPTSSNIDSMNYSFKSIELLNTEENDANEDSNKINVNVNLINANDFECSLCYRYNI